MKDFFEFILTSLIFGLLNGWDISFAGYVMPNVINEASRNSFWMFLFNFDSLLFFERFKHNTLCNLNITTK